MNTFEVGFRPDLLPLLAKPCVCQFARNHPFSFKTIASNHSHEPLLQRRAVLRAGEEAAVMSFKVIDFGHARLIGDKPGAKLPGSPAMEKWYRRCLPLFTILL